MNELDILRRVALEAANRSHDPKTQNGAGLVTRQAPSDVLLAANCFPAGLERRPERLISPEKYQWMEHAERNVIYKAGTFGFATGGATMYCLWFACPDCARAIIQAGIYEVVGHIVPRNSTPARWGDAVAEGEKMLREAGVTMRWLAGRLDVKIKFDGGDLWL